MVGGVRSITTYITPTSASRLEALGKPLSRTAESLIHDALTDPACTFHSDKKISVPLTIDPALGHVLGQIRDDNRLPLAEFAERSIALALAEPGTWRDRRRPDIVTRNPKGGPYDAVTLTLSVDRYQRLGTVAGPRKAANFLRRAMRLYASRYPLGGDPEPWRPSELNSYQLKIRLKGSDLDSLRTKAGHHTISLASAARQAIEFGTSEVSPSSVSRQTPNARRLAIIGNDEIIRTLRGLKVREGSMSAICAEAARQYCEADRSGYFSRRIPPEYRREGDVDVLTVTIVDSSTAEAVDAIAASEGRSPAEILLRAVGIDLEQRGLWKSDSRPDRPRNTSHLSLE